jgi:hypothetical protein
MILRLKHLLAGLSILACTAATANADLINGIFWSVPAATADNVPTLGDTPGPYATEWGTFTASAIDFSGDAPGAFNLGGFLNSFGAASNIVYMNGATASTDLSNVLFEFTGTAYFTNGQGFSVVHDDGLNLYVNGSLVLGAPDETAPITSNFTYNGPTGNENFDFIYANGPPTQADFQTTLVSPVTLVGTPVPEPSTIVLLLTGSSALWSLRRRSRSPSQN